MKLTKSKLQQIIKEELENLTLLGEVVQSSDRITSYDLLKWGNNSQNAFGYLMTLSDDRLSEALNIINSEPQDHPAYSAGIQAAKEVIQKIESLPAPEEKRLSKGDSCPPGSKAGETAQFNPNTQSWDCDYDWDEESAEVDKRLTEND